jgi:pyridinium-3,5-biscarboxylic acid mononucleotide synthase
VEGVSDNHAFHLRPDEGGSPVDDLVTLRLDHDRAARTGVAEAVYGPGKTPEQAADAVDGLLAGPGSGPVILTRADVAQAAAALARRPGGVRTGTGPRTSVVSWRSAAPRPGDVALFAAGTADLPVAREAAAVLSAYGYRATLTCDVGVAGLHRLLAETPRLRAADVVLVVAGMEGALASVVAGLTAAPVIAVPTSTGYGASLDGITALLAMHASCSPGITVVGIDNGFGAACAAVRILGHR